MHELYIGLMSGTSMDGIDAALVDLSGGRASVQVNHCRQYPDSLRHRLEAALRLQDPLGADLEDLDAQVGEEFAAATNELLKKADVGPDEIIAIGSHGQTIRHEPDAARPYSLQLGNAATISSLTGIDTVADFRRADIEAGGQGAPLVPAFHSAIFRSATENRVVVNIGGIANITVLPADRALAVTGFDTGPGNTLMDAWIRRHLGEPFDRHGAWAGSGSNDARLLAAMLGDSYFRMAPPKSTGREYFNISWLSSYLQGVATPVTDTQTTLAELTAVSIADAIEMHAKGTQRVLVCGGGVHNDYLMQRLGENLANLPVESTATAGVDPDWVEAMAFAWLAKQHLEGKPGNVPEVTGASQAVVLGKLHRYKPGD